MWHPWGSSEPKFNYNECLQRLHEVLKQKKIFKIQFCLINSFLINYILLKKL